MTEKEKMLASLPYKPVDAALQAERLACKLLLKELNTQIYTSGKENSILLKTLLPNASKDLLLEPPFFCDYGYNIFCGKRVFINVNCTFLDAAKITIGDNVLFGPNVQVYTATHPVNAEERKHHALAKPIEIGSNCWIGGSSLLLPGLKIGDNVIVAAGSVVTKDVESNTMVGGNPARILKTLIS